MTPTRSRRTAASPRDTRLAVPRRFQAVLSRTVLEISPIMRSR
jgi:hypothetical protein